jgi:hypothetical protein
MRRVEQATYLVDAGTRIGSKNGITGEEGHLDGFHFGQWVLGYPGK